MSEYKTDFGRTVTTKDDGTKRIEFYDNESASPRAIAIITGKAATLQMLNIAGEEVGSHKTMTGDYFDHFSNIDDLLFLIDQRKPRDAKHLMELDHELSLEREHHDSHTPG